MRTRRALLAYVCLLSLTAAGWAATRRPAIKTRPAPQKATEARPGAGRPVEIEIERGLAARLEAGRLASLVVVPKSGDSWRTIAQRFCAPPVSWQSLRQRASGKDPLRGVPFAIPFSDLSDPWKVLLLLSLFPGDSIDRAEWVHRPSVAAVESYGEGLWQAAEWFTGRGENFPSLRRVASAGSGATLPPPGAIDPMIGPGEEVRIPIELLRPGLAPAEASAAAGAPAADTTDAPPMTGADATRAAALVLAGKGVEPSDDQLHVSPASGSTELTYISDSSGRFAIYRLKAGEAIYSAVAVRFTGRVDPDEVNEAALRIARSSSIKNVASIPVGFAIRIPIDLLLPEYLSPGDPARTDYDRSVAEAARYQNSVRVRNLDGVHVILDAGHGGVDPGVIANGVNEHEYAYDVLCRVKRKLERETAATVHPLIADRKTGFSPRDLKTLKPNHAEQLLTDPPHSNHDSGQTILGVNLRWYLANSILRKLESKGVASDHVVFISLHADSLHPTLTGGMVYIPGDRYRHGTYGSASSEYVKYREVREEPHVTISRDDGIRAEGLSRQFAGLVIDSLRQQGLAVHLFAPVRDRIIRQSKAWVPAVLRANRVPVEVLVEIANLNNADDARLVRDPAFREKTSTAIVNALLHYYGQS